MDQLYAKKFNNLLMTNVPIIITPDRKKCFLFQFLVNGSYKIYPLYTFLANLWI